MIETITRDYLDGQLEEGVYMEVPETRPTRFVVVENTGTGDEEKALLASRLAIQSYAESLFEAARLCYRVIEAMRALPDSIDSVTRAELNSAYNYTETDTKEYRYQAVFDVIHYEEVESHA